MSPHENHLRLQAFRCNRWGDLHRLAGCLHIISTPAPDEGSNSEQCGTNCVVDGAPKIALAPFLCLQCLEEHFISQYVAIQDKFTDEHPGIAWPVDDAANIANIEKIKEIAWEAGVYIRERVPEVREPKPYSGPPLTVALDVDTTAGISGGGGDAADEGDSDGEPDVGERRDGVAIGRDGELEFQGVSFPMEMPQLEGLFGALLLVAEIEKLEAEQKEVASGARADAFIEEMVSNLQAEVKTLEHVQTKASKKRAEAASRGQLIIKTSIEVSRLGET
ncbi:uncharacterized protein BDZ99DRAFT_542027 [Mytilinidion resinicola]|uniref:Uncharacterized protein n=1 Tax=Mytilinidion resinicola TaxID=574789 RepID=A0A6A6Z5F8_9PEZI|nr:uncharacterized protein BDZ99DRAFT_542027 [Mytilinidion resinicola]KAF2815969.1 hypothetical protein BDZ99DRAFT_542027 [Mytilinidion resinicola]